MEQIEVGTVYEWVKKEKEASQPMSDNKINELLSNIGAWFSVDLNNQYYMLLSNENRDYTVFNFLTDNYYKAVQELKEVLSTRGNIHSIDYNHAEKYYEIWMKKDDELSIYLLFPCNDFIIEI